MKVFVISDLHLSTTTNKPMEVFGDEWIGYVETIKKDWLEKVQKDDLVLLSGDISWGMTIDEAKEDYALLDTLPGIKVVGKGNHDFYWSSLNKMNKAFPNFNFLYNNAFRFGNVVICGTRGWLIPDETKEDYEQDKKIYDHELLRFKFSLEEMKKLRQEGDTVICMFHFPPFDATYTDTEFTQLVKENNMDIVVYGHLHGKNARVSPIVTKDDIPYYLTSADLVNFKLTQLV
ncbi:MAG: metallophosphoesterase [Clostridia bacterium]|nr:metallophosphoesterase [Clostridia bacterium]